jgi:hypothetical protein
MLTLTAILFILQFAAIPSVPYENPYNKYLSVDLGVVTEDPCVETYFEAGLEGLLDYQVFKRAYYGASYFDVPRKDILTIIDYSKPCCEKRFYLIDIRNRKLLCHTLVAHGKNSGDLVCKKFSNAPRSLQSSPGFFLTAETYSGKHGYSLRLDGLEPGINDQARPRAIVIHGADYVCQRYVDDFGYIGKSWGCPALPVEVNQEVIDMIKGGSCIYIHTDNPSYTSNSALKTLSH